MIFLVVQYALYIIISPAHNLSPSLASEKFFSSLYYLHVVFLGTFILFIFVALGILSTIKFAFCIFRARLNGEICSSDVIYSICMRAIWFSFVAIVSELFIWFVCHHFSSLVHHHAKYLTCLTEEIIVGLETFGFVTVMVTLDKCVFSEWELRFR